MPLSDAIIERIDVSAYTMRTERPETDGTFAWDRTIMIVVEIEGGGKTGIGYTYADEATGRFIAETLAPRLVGREVMDVPARYREMRAAVRNVGQPGVSAMAISAIDIALWDLKAKLFDAPLCRVLGAVQEQVDIYASGGFASYGIDQLQEQLGGWASRGIRRVKMKVGRRPEDDVRRVHAVRQAVGDAEIFVDANGAYERKQAIAMAERFAELGVTYFEEPVSAADIAGMRLVRDRAPMDVAAGEYGFEPTYFERLLSEGAVDVLQADLTRCGGVTGFLRVAALCEAHHVPLSVHCAPAASLHAALSAPMVRHLEYFHDHVRMESRLFDGAPTPDGGVLEADLSRPGLGIELRQPEAADVIVEEEQQAPAH